MFQGHPEHIETGSEVGDGGSGDGGDGAWLHEGSI
jgi:hypothetical protein